MLAMPLACRHPIPASIGAQDAEMKLVLQRGTHCPLKVITHTHRRKVLFVGN